MNVLQDSSQIASFFLKKVENRKAVKMTLLSFMLYFEKHLIRKCKR